MVGFRRGRQKVANRRKGHPPLVGKLPIRQSANQSSARDIPQLDASIEPTDGQARAVRGKADGESAHQPVGERVECAAAALLPEITPLPAAEVFLARLRPMSVQQPARSTEIVQLERLLGEVHVRYVEQAA